MHAAQAGEGGMHGLFINQVLELLQKLGRRYGHDSCRTVSVLGQVRRGDQALA